MCKRSIIVCGRPFSLHTYKWSLHPLHTLPHFDCCIHPPLVAPAASLSIPEAIEPHLHHGTPPSVTTIKHHLHLSLPPRSLFLSIATINHRPLLQPSNAIFAAIIFHHLNFICHQNHLPLCPSPPSNTATCHCHSLLQLSNTIFATGHRCPLPSFIAASIKCLQMPPPHLNVSAHCRWWRLQRKAENGGRGQCLMTVMVGVAAAAGRGSASSGCG